MTGYVMVDLRACDGHGLCASVAPDVFELGDDDKPIKNEAELTEPQLERALLAEQSCPCQAITVHLHHQRKGTPS